MKLSKLFGSFIFLYYICSETKKQIYMETLDELKKHLEETPEEVLKQEMFELECELEGIDPKAPNARKQLAKKYRGYNWNNEILPRILRAICLIFTIYCAFQGGVELETRGWFMSCVYVVASLGWLNLYMRYKLGQDYLDY